MDLDITDLDITYNLDLTDFEVGGKISAVVRISVIVRME